MYSRLSRDRQKTANPLSGPHEFHELESLPAERSAHMHSGMKMCAWCEIRTRSFTTSSAAEPSN